MLYHRTSKSGNNHNRQGDTMADETIVNGKMLVLQQKLRDLGRILIAYSGGVDSTFLLKIAVQTLGRDNVLAVISAGPVLPRAELETARSLAEQIGVDLLEVQTSEMYNPKFRANPIDRCFHCKSILFERLEPIAAEHHMRAILTGLNADDLGDYRPGIQAARQHGVHEPMAAAGLTKAEIRLLSRRYGLPTADKPASPCLASRIPYGEPVTPEKLRQIEQGEIFLRGLGLTDCRVRHHGKLARLELPAPEVADFAQPAIREKIVRRFKELGFTFVALDLQGFRSGGLNEVLKG
jgi:pyridinium-3,5-biscarboxylic acid mononucleotide sulfurtransferase